MSCWLLMLTPPSYLMSHQICEKTHLFIATIINNYQNADFPIKYLKMDNQLNIIEIVEYLNSFQMTYQFSPPYEHEFIGRIGRNNRTTQDKLSCALAISSAKNKTLWLHALVTRLLN